jgi:hypothetical protein
LSDAAASDSGSSGTTSSAAAAVDSFSSAIPLIVNPVFAEVFADVADATAVSSAHRSPPPPAAADSLVQRPSHSAQSLSAPASDSGLAHDRALASDTGTFSVVVSMISGRNMSIELPRHLLQKNSLHLDDVRGGGRQSPVDEPSPLVSSF